MTHARESVLWSIAAWLIYCAACLFWLVGNDLRAASAIGFACFALLCARDARERAAR